MRMRELENRSGVGRETIRFYIREGLLPEPERPSRNSASYSDEHLTRLAAIRTLQEERFLPLAVIKSVLDGEGGRWLEPAAFPGLDRALRERFDDPAERLTALAAAEASGLPLADIEQAIGFGILRSSPDNRFSARQVAIMRVLGRLSRIGFTEENGFPAGFLRSYVDLVGWIAEQELKLFFEGAAGRVDERAAAEMATQGIAAINELFALMRTGEILRRLAARRTLANDNG